MNQGEQTVEHFEGFTEDLERMADWRTQNEASKWRWRRRRVLGNVACYIASTLQPRPKARDDTNTCSLSAKPGGSTPE